TARTYSCDASHALWTRMACVPRASPAGYPPPLSSPPTPPLRSVPPGNRLHHPRGRVRRRAAGRAVRRRRARIRPGLLRAQGLRAPGLDQAPGGADGDPRILVGDLDRHHPLSPRGGRLAHLRPGAQPGTPPAAAIASIRSTFRLVLSYDGTAYHGWQVQAGARPVQGTLVQAPPPPLRAGT